MNILRYRCLTDYKHSSIFPAIFPFFFFFLQEVGISRQLIIWPRNVKSRVGTCKLNLPVADVFYIHTIFARNVQSGSVSESLYPRKMRLLSQWLFHIHIQLNWMSRIIPSFLSVGAHDLCSLSYHVCYPYFPLKSLHIWFFTLKFFSIKGILLPFLTNLSGIVYSKYS